MLIVILMNVFKIYFVCVYGDCEIVVVDDVIFLIDKGDVFGIIGYFGVGKLIFVCFINVFEFVMYGIIIVDGVDIMVLKESELCLVCGGIGMIF